MTNKSSERKTKILEIIGLYEIIGGSIGLGLIFYGILSINKITFLSILFWLIIVSFYSFSIYAGVKLFNWGMYLTHTIIIQNMSHI